MSSRQRSSSSRLAGLIEAHADVVLLHPVIVTVCWVARAWCRIILLNVHDAHFNIDHAQSASWLNTLGPLLGFVT